MIQIKRSELKQLAQNILKDDSIESQNEILIKIATAMCARTSYTVIGEEKEVNYENLIALTDRMINQVPFHASPFEHCARVMDNQEYSGDLNNEQLGFSKTTNKNTERGWCANFRGFISFRYLLEK